MFHLEVLQNRWLFLAIFGGISLVFAMALAHIALWQPRQTQTAETPAKSAAWISTRRAIPWILILTYLGVAAYSTAYVLMSASNPPNW